jgi:hypothetical protein
VELVNEEGVVIGRQNVTLSAGWETGFSDGKTTSSKSGTTTPVRFPSVDANKLTDRLAVRIASLNGTDAEAAAQANSVSIMTKTAYKRYVEAPRSPSPEIRYAQEWVEYLKTPESWHDGWHSIGETGPAGGIVFGRTSENGITRFVEAAPASTEFSTGFDHYDSSTSVNTASNKCRSITVNGIGGWRLPTSFELGMMESNKRMIGGFVDAWYFSSTFSHSYKLGNKDIDLWVLIHFGDGRAGDLSNARVRAVRVF